MNVAYPNQTAEASVFNNVAQEFAQLITRVGSEKWLELEHDEIEQRVEVQGREVLRQLLEGHMTLRGMGQLMGKVVGSDGIERPLERKDGSRQLGTVLGTVTVPRSGYYARGSSSLFPVDADLNLPQEKHSMTVRRRAAELAALSSFETSTELLRKMTGSTAGKRQVEELVRTAALDFDSFYANTTLNPALGKTGPVLVLTFDMKGVVLRKEDLRPETRAAAAQDVPSSALDKRKVNRKLHRKRMAMVAAVYTVEHYVRTPEQVVATLRRVHEDNKQTKPRPRNEYKRVWTSLERTPQKVIEEAFKEALSRDPDKQKTWVILVDGDPKQLKWVKKAARRHRVNVRIVLDIIHVIQYLWKAGKAFNTTDAKFEEVEAWVAERLLRVLKGKAGLVAGGMRRSATKMDMSAKDRKPIDKCASYLKKYAKYLRYDEALTIGTPISTGVIEGACRHLLADRVDITGARWSLEGVEAVLKIRALRSSGDFDDYWDFHREKEFERNHKSLYADGMTPLLFYPWQYGKLRLVGN